MTEDRPIDGLAADARKWAKSAPDLKIDPDAALRYISVLGPVIAALGRNGFDGLDLPPTGTVVSAGSVRDRVHDDIHLPVVGVLATYRTYAEYCTNLALAIRTGIENTQTADGP